ncbi:MAG TPA: SH3 domain-containing protein [Turneriella sp.]|nr:SH3 domain-containing protein [Turneriella sp.]
MKRLLLLIIYSTGLAHALERISDKTGYGFEILHKEDRIFYVWYRKNANIRHLSIDRLQSESYSLDVTFEEENGNLSNITMRKANKSKKQSAPVGRHIYFGDQGEIGRYFYASGTDGGYGIAEPCDVEYWYDDAGQVHKEKKTIHKRPCKYGKGNVAFFTPPGEYYVTEGPLRVRKEPNLKSPTVVTLANDEKLTVTDFTTERLEINGSYAPWSKVKTAKGEGWVYGAYIDPVDWNKTYTSYFKNIDWQAFVKKLGLE